jgi:hypothetical protein
MSDFEDDMDVDGPPPDRSIKFSSDNTTAKGKRIVADLPVEAEDNLPWYVASEILEWSVYSKLSRVEKYRPNTLDDVSGHQDILATINRFVEHNVRPSTSFILRTTDDYLATPPSPVLRSTRHGQNIHDPRTRSQNLRAQKHPPNGPGIECLRRPWH